MNGGMLTFLGQALSKVSDKFYQLVTDYKPLGLSDFMSYSLKAKRNQGGHDPFFCIFAPAELSKYSSDQEVPSPFCLSLSPVCLFFPYLYLLEQSEEGGREGGVEGRVSVFALLLLQTVQHTVTWKLLLYY